MEPDNAPITQPEPTQERRTWKVVYGAMGITVITLFILLFGDFATGRAIHKLAESSDPLRIKVIGHQWWWEVQYLQWPERFGEVAPSNIVFTANEIHIPVDTQKPVAVEIQLDSADVIHSFWVPSLHGKKDLIPGHPTSHWIRADRTGTFWGECAEYCGYQHAQMRITLVAEPAEQFRAWLEAQRADAPAPANDIQKRGQTVFLHTACAMCHAIQGTEARGSLGPDLTHFASRKLLASGAAPNVRGHLAGWVSNPQAMKPGVRMPPNNLSPHDLLALLEYLETLK
jgi:cytochrome c oxidase subunit 2